MKILKRRLSPEANKYFDESQNPWAGLASYEDPEKAERKLKFCGRDNDSYDVAKLIIGNIFVTLYGKSGIGKTSLLNAGVFPELRKEQYTPLSLRLGIRDEEHPESFQKIIIDAIEHTVSRVEVVNVIEEQTEMQTVDFLWNYFARHRFYDRYDKPTTPVVVLDQFEEIFRFDRQEADALLRQIDYINDKDHILDNCIVDGQPYRYKKNFRFVSSIREDDLYRLEDSIDNCYLPALKRCRYRLRSLSEQGARDAILIPGEGLFIDSTKNRIVNTIIQITQSQEDHSINTNLLSLICSRLYIEYINSDNSHILPSLVYDFVNDNPFYKFYNEATKSFSDKEKTYIETHFVDATGRRNSVPENEFMSFVPKGDLLLKGDNRIFQRTSTASDNNNYRIELIHDSFCKPLAELKEKRKRQKRIIWLFMTSSIALLCIGIIAIILYLYSALCDERDNMITASLRMMKNQSLAVAEKASILLEDGDLETCQLLAINVLPEKLTNPNRPYTPECELLLRRAYQHDDVLLKHDAKVTSASISPDGSKIVSVTNDSIAYIWSREGECLKNLTGHTKTINKIVFSPNGKYIATCSADKTMRVWDGNGDIVETLTDNDYEIIDIHFSPDSRFLYSRDVNNNIRILETSSWVCSQTFNGKKGFFFSNSHFICIAENIISIWNLDEGSCYKQIEYDGSESFVDINPNGKEILSTKEYCIILRNIDSGKINHVLTEHDGDIVNAKYDYSGKFIVSSAYDNKIRIWNSKTGQCLKVLDTKNSLGSRILSFFPNDNTHILSLFREKDIRVWDLEENRLNRLKISVDNTKGGAVSYSNNGKIIASSGDNNLIYLWNASTGEKIHTLRGHNASVRSIAFNPKDNFLLSSSHDSTLRIWDVKTEKCIAKVKVKGYLKSASYNKKGTQIISCCDSMIQIWDANKLNCIKIVKGKFGSYHSADFNPNSNLIVTTGDSNIAQVIDANSGKIILQLTGHSSWVSGAEFSPDGNKIVTTSLDHSTRIWDVSTNTCESIISHEDGRFFPLPIACYSRDGNYIAIGVGESVKVVDSNTGSMVGEFIGHTKMIFSIAFSPNGREIASASIDGTIRIWSFPPLQELIDKTLMRLGTRQLTQKERQEYYLE
jgi:WD40 repeat protein